MGLFAPALLLGLIAAVVPYLVHRIGRRPPRPVPFAAMQLLYEAERRVRARKRLREALLLVLRTLAAAALPFIFARPFLLQESVTPQITSRPQSAVIVLDDSASMQRRLGSGTLWDRAHARARDIVRQVAPESTLALVLASEAGLAPIGDLTLERARVLDALGRTRVTARPADFAQALVRAETILATATHDERRIYVITDGQKNGWEHVPQATTGDGIARILLDVGAGARAENRALLALDAAPDPSGGPGGIQVTVEAAVWGGDGRPVGITLLVDGRAVTKGFIEIKDGTRARKRFVHVLPDEGTRVHDLVAELEPDDFPLDDRRYLRFALGQAPRVLLVNGDPRTEKTEDEVFFLESALRSMGGGTTVQTVLPDDVDEELIDRFSVVVLANVAAPSETLVRLLERHVGAGKGVFLSVGDKVNPEAWNAQMGALLPQPLALIRTAAALPGQGPGELYDSRPAERLAPLDRTHPLLAAFSGTDDGLSSARFFKYMLLAPTPEDGSRTVVLRYESGAPALVERRFLARGQGRDPGRVVLLSTTIDRGWTDLPIRPGFLPLVAHLMRHLSGTPHDGPAHSLLPGQPRPVSLPAGYRRIEIEKPDHTIWVAHRKDDEPERIVTFTETDLPGIYRSKAATASNTLVALPGEDFAVNLDPRESDPTRLFADPFVTTRSPDPSSGPPPRHPVPLWHALGTLLMLVLLGESLLSLARRRRTLA